MKFIKPENMKKGVYYVYKTIDHEGKELGRNHKLIDWNIFYLKKGMNKDGKMVWKKDYSFLHREGFGMDNEKWIKDIGKIFKAKIVIVDEPVWTLNVDNTNDDYWYHYDKYREWPITQDKKRHYTLKLKGVDVKDYAGNYKDYDKWTFHRNGKRIKTTFNRETYKFKIFKKLLENTFDVKISVKWAKVSKNLDNIK